MSKLRFLTICEGGAVRSVALAAVLRWDFKQDAIPVSGLLIPEETLFMLCEWADYIIVLVPKYAERISPTFKKKTRVIDIGPDKWMNALHKELLNLMGDMVQKWKSKEWDI